MPSETPNHGYNRPDRGREDWGRPLNENFAAIDADVAIRDADANRDEYEPKAGAKFEATDSGAVYYGDGSEWVPADRRVERLRAESVNGMAVAHSGPEIQAKIDEVEADGFVALVPGETYEIDEPIEWPNTEERQALYLGTPHPDGRQATTIAPSSSFSGDALVKLHGSAGDPFGSEMLCEVGLSGIRLNGRTENVTLVDARYVGQVRYDHVFFTRCRGHGLYNYQAWDARYRNCRFVGCGDDDADTWATYFEHISNNHYFQGCRWGFNWGGFFRVATPSDTPCGRIFFSQCKLHGWRDPERRPSVPHVLLTGRTAHVSFDQCHHQWMPEVGIRIGDDVDRVCFSNSTLRDSYLDDAGDPGTETLVEVNGEAYFQGCHARGADEAQIDATNAALVVDAGNNDFATPYNEGAVTVRDPNDRVVHTRATGTGSGPLIRDERDATGATLARLDGGTDGDVLDVGRRPDGAFAVRNDDRGADLLALTEDGDLRLSEGTVQLSTRADDPTTADLPDGACTFYVSDGSDGVTGADGDVVAAVNRGGTVKTTTVLEFGAE